MLFITDQERWVNVRDIEAFERVGEEQTRVVTRQGTKIVLDVKAADVITAITAANS